jgi:hypothetical protein
MEGIKAPIRPSSTPDLRRSAIFYEQITGYIRELELLSVDNGATLGSFSRRGGSLNIGIVLTSAEDSGASISIVFLFPSRCRYSERRHYS